MASLHGNRKLRHLGLAELPEITDDGVKVCERDSMGAHSDNVYKELRNVLYWVSSTPLHQRMCRGLQWLETLDLSECEALSSQALQTLAYHCHYLTHLHLSNCYNVRDYSLLQS